MKRAFRRFRRWMRASFYDAPIVTPRPTVAVVVRAETTIERLPISCSLEPEERPAFKRLYQTSLPGGFGLKIWRQRAHFGNGRDFYSLAQIKQPGGQWVYFDPDNVADKIIDRELCPQVQIICDRVRELDDDFFGTRPEEFTDKDGVHWRRVA